MIREAFEPYLQVFIENTTVDRGHSLFYWPAVLWFRIAAAVMWMLGPLHLGERLLCRLKRNDQADAIIEFIGSQNNLLVADKIMLPNRVRVTFNVKSSKPSTIHLSEALFLLVAHLYARETVSALLQARGCRRLRANCIRVVKAAAIENLGRALMRGKRVLLQYNDHSPYSVMLRLVAESLGLKTAYVQHAPVSERFPRLEHDLNGLFGQSSVDKYLQKGFDCGKRYFVITDIRFPRRCILDRGSHEEVLVCYNPVDDLGAVLDCARALIARGHALRIRPHPRDRRRPPRLRGAKVSCGTDIWRDLSRACVVIANESGVHLEAAYYGVNTFKLATFSRSFDNYGFLKHGLLRKEHFSLKELIADLEAGVRNINDQCIDYFIGDMSNRVGALAAFQSELVKLSL